jgi:integrase
MSRNLATELEPLTLAAYVATWPERATEKLSAYLRRRCRWMLRAHILPALGTRPLADLTRDDVRAHLVSLLAGGLAPLTVRHMFRVLRAVLDSALVEGLVAENVGFGASRGLGLERRKDAPPPRPRRDDEADAELPPGTGMVPETFAAFARFWLADRMRAGSLKRSSVGGYRAVLAIVLRDLQALTAEFDPPLSAITRTVVRQMLTAQLDRGYASSSVRLHLAVLRGVLNAARLDYELLPGTNPCERLGHFLPRRPGPRTQTAIDRAHVAGFVAAARTLNLTIATLILVGFRTGMRLGELLGLRWDDVDLPRERVTVRHTLDRRGTLGSPKGGRVVDLPLAPGVCSSRRPSAAHGAGRTSAA